MQARIPFSPARFDAVFKAMVGLHSTVDASGLEPSLLHLVRMRVSQINGCGYCLDIHSKEARRDGESEQRLYLLSAWREAPMFSARERAALAWAETLTNIRDRGVPDDIYTQVSKEFEEKDLAALSLAVVEINGWNRFAIAFNLVPGSFRLAKSA